MNSSSRSSARFCIHSMTSAMRNPRVHAVARSPRFGRTFASSASIPSSSVSQEADNFVRIVEVSPRDGLQNEKRTIATETKVELIRRLAGTGLGVIEAGAFVSPKWVPQMADSASVLTRLPQVLPPNLHSKLSFPVLVPNAKGLDTLLSLLASSRSNTDPQSSGAPLTDEISVFTAASDAFTRANTNCTIDESLRRIEEIFERVRSSGQEGNNLLRVRAYISVVLGCPYSGKVDPALVARMTRTLLEMGAYEVSLGDTIGAGTPSGVRALLNALEKEGVDVGGQLEKEGGLGGRRRVQGVAAHCHDTFGTGLANVLEFVRGGVRVVDASVSGLGGCPYSPGATGNIDTESVVQALHAEGYETGVNLLELARVGQWISDEVRGQGSTLFPGSGSDGEAGSDIRAVNLNASSAGRAILARESREKPQDKAKL
ncbi:unnamed protein product [Tilletia laevis]|uniref:hydroxymethylglutaryl-CoA lyase n=2 Tax=Tilletia TaxID=13289 RepID=A0A9N8LEC0_9BASI|nr:hypothetical protein CF335_g6970 [Tilletia laevis]CAD6911364.1 unnamed protein product [Tilletia laevis]CAD6918209.1 unnamed protein product [Tilletia laevis]